MAEQFVEVFVGVHSADAEQVQLSYEKGNLVLRYIDWKEQERYFEFEDTVAFRWQEYDDVQTPRDDVSYEVINSKWLQAQSSGMLDASRYAHYKICFNACGVLDLLCRKVTNVEGA